MRADNTPKHTGESYIRMLPYSSVKYLSLMLDIDKNWEKMVVKIPKRLPDVGKAQSEKRYSTLQVRLFEEKSKRPDGSPTKAILDDWSTQNAKVKHLLRILQEASLYEAANYLSVEVLHEGAVARLDISGGDHTGELPVPTWEDSKPKQLDEPKDVRKSDDHLSTNMDVPGGKTIYTRNKNFDSPDKDQTASTYNSLLKSADGGPEYNKLLPNNDKGVNYHRTPSFDSLLKSADGGPEYNKLLPSNDKGVNYHRTPSFDSWGAVSVQNEGGNDGSRKSSGIEHEETYQIRPIRDETNVKQVHDDGVYTYAKGVYQLAKEVPEPANDPYNKGPASPQRQEPQRREPCQNEDQSGSTTPEEDLYKILAKQNLTYSLLQIITDDFNPKLLKDGGRIIGMGGFGEVFLGKFENGFQVAIKRLKNVEEGIEKQFETELNSLVKYRHRNIVRLFGFSVDGPGKCLVYEYLCNGSLEDRLMRLGQTPALQNDVRLSILKGTAQGISYLNGQGTIHRDIKSANVLLDENFKPKVGDFATARSGPRGNATKAMSTQVVIGTSAYLAPEAYNFDVSTKLDSYSFGIVILEVLTSLPPLDHSRDEKDIKSYVEDRDITPLLDTSGGKWSDDTVATLIGISEKCTCRKRNRVNVQDILPDLMTLV